MGKQFEEFLSEELREQRRQEALQFMREVRSSIALKIATDLQRQDAEIFLEKHPRKR